LLELWTTIGHGNEVDGVAAGKVQVGVTAGAIAPQIPAETRSAVGQSASSQVEVSGVTIRHQPWLADAVAGFAMLFVLYFILLEFSKARLP